MAISRDNIKSLIKSASEREQFQALHWEGTFDDYLDVVARDPKVVRNAFQRLYDLIISFGVKETSDGKRGIVTVETKGINQRQEEVCTFTRRLMVWKRDHAPTRHYPYGDEVFAE